MPPERNPSQLSPETLEAIHKAVGISPTLVPTKNTSSYGDWVVGEFIHKRKMDFFQGNIVKYVDRHARKDGKRDLLKAKDYIDKLIELNYKD